MISSPKPLFAAQLPKAPKLDKAKGLAEKAESATNKALEIDGELATTILKVLVVVLALLLVAVVLYFVLGFVLRKIRAYRAKAAMQRELDQNGQDAAPQNNGGSELQAAFDERMAELSSSKAGERSLHLMPWYLVLGPEGSGKSSILRQSGLEYPYLEGSQRGIPELRSGPTEECDCWVSSQGVFLDIAGKHTDLGADPKDWEALLGSIAKFRQGTPLNGILLTVNLELLAEHAAHKGSARSGIHKFGRSMRASIDRIYNLLGFRLPVYLIVTQCDRIEGFSNLVSSLTSSEKHAPLGVTVPLFGAPRDLSNHLSEQLDELNDQIYEHCTRQIARSSVPQGTEALYAFPQNFSSYKDALLAFAGALTHNAGRSENLLLRGLYFSSALQEQDALENLLRSRGRGAITPQDQDSEAQESSGLFLQGLFSQVLFPDRAFSQQTRSAKDERFRRRLMWSTGIGTVALAVLLLPWNSASRYKSLEQEAVAHVRSLKGGDQPLDRYTSRSAIETYQALAKLESRIEEPREVRIAGLAWGMSNDSQLEPAYSGFMDRVVNEWAQDWMRTLAERDRDYLERIQQRYANSPSSLRGKELRATYDALGRYLLLTDVGDLGARTPEQNEWLAKHLVSEQHQLEKIHKENKPRLTQDSGLAKRLAQTIVANESLRLPGDEDVTILSRKLLKDVEREQIPEFVDAMVAEVNSKTRRHRFELTNFTDKLSRGFLKASSKAPFVPGAFTKNVWESLVRAEILQEAKNPAYLTQQRNQALPPLWIRGIRSESQWHADRRGDLRAVYVNRYGHAWRAFLNGLSIQRGEDDTAILTMLEKLADAGASPYYGLFEGVRDNVLLPKASQKLEEGEATDAPAEADAAGYMMHMMRPFAQFGAIVPGEKPDRPLPLDAFTALIAELRDAMLAQNETPAGAATFRKVHNRIKRRASQLVRVQSSKWTEVLVRLIEHPIQFAQRHASLKRSGSLQDEWCSNVVASYRRQFRGKYPYRENSGGPEVDLTQFTNFFHPENGTLWQAAASFEDYVVKRGDVYVPVNREGSPKVINPAVVAFLNQSARLAAAFFPAGSPGPKLSFSVEAQARSGLERTELTLGDRHLRQINGPTVPEKFVWPAEGDSQDVTLKAWYSRYGAHHSATTKDSQRAQPLPDDPGALPFHRPETGTWALFKLLESRNASVEEVGDYNFSVSWAPVRRPTDPRVVLHFKVPNGVAPFFGDPEKQKQLMGLFRSSTSRIPSTLLFGGSQEPVHCPER